MSALTFARPFQVSGTRPLRNAGKMGTPLGALKMEADFYNRAATARQSRLIEGRPPPRQRGEPTGLSRRCLSLSLTLALHDHRPVVGRGDKSAASPTLTIDAAFADLLDDVVPCGTTKFAGLLITRAPRRRCTGHLTDDAAGPGRRAVDHMAQLPVSGVCLFTLHASRKRDRAGRNGRQ